MGLLLPSAAAFLRACTLTGVDVAAAFERFFRRRPDWLQHCPADSEAAVAGLLKDLQGKVPINVLAVAVGTNRYTVSRWLNGTACPRLHEFLAMVEGSSRRMIDFVAVLVDPAQLPSLINRWQTLQRLREAAYETPWSHAVLCALELPFARRSEVGTRSWLHKQLGISFEELEQTIDTLRGSGQLTERDGRLAIVPQGDVDTSWDAGRAQQLKAHWARTALNRLEDGSPGFFGYAVFAISRQDLRRLRDLQLEYVRQINSIITESRSEQCVGLFCTQLLDLSIENDNALGDDRISVVEDE